ncbi:MAG: Dabb family protein [Pirellulaceae bacterium]|nr:Dabb family protein [Pirellulaceae bacterium]
MRFLSQPRNLLTIIALVGALGSVPLLYSRIAQANQPEERLTGLNSDDEKLEGAKVSQQKSLLRHVVLFQFKADATSEEVARLVNAFGELPKKIEVIVDYEYGTNNSPEELNADLSHCFLLTFRSEKDRDTYLKHPAHQAFVDVVLPRLQKAVVVDYWAQR